MWDVNGDINDYIETDKLIEGVKSIKETAEVSSWDELSFNPQNVSQYFKFKAFGDDSFDESEVSDYDLRKLRRIASGKIKNETYKEGIGYKDYGIDEKSVLKDGVVVAGIKSMFDSNLRMATLLGRSDITVEDGGVYIRDTYDFNKGPKRTKYKTLVDAGKTKEASKFLSTMSTLEKESVEAYMKNPKQATKGGVRIFLGTLEELNK